MGPVGTVGPVGLVGPVEHVDLWGVYDMWDLDGLRDLWVLCLHEGASAPCGTCVTRGLCGLWNLNIEYSPTASSSKFGLGRERPASC